MLPPNKALYQIPSLAEQHGSAKESYLLGKLFSKLHFLTQVPSQPMVSNGLCLPCTWLAIYMRLTT